MARKRLVRVHQVGDRPTLEGILTRRRPYYELEGAKVVESEDVTVPLDGGAEVLREHVAFVQLLAKAG